MKKVRDKKIEQLVLEIGKRALLEKGVKGWNMDDISRQCAMSKRTLYKIISSKEELLHQIFRESIVGSTDRLESFLHSDRPFEAVYNELSQQYIDGFDDYVLTNQRILNIVYPQIHELNQTYIKIKNAITCQFFERGMELGYIDERISPDTIIRLIHAIIEHKLNSTTSVEQFRGETKELLDGLFTTLTTRKK